MSNLGIRVGGRQRAPLPPCWSSCGSASASSPKICMPSTGAFTLRWQPVAHLRRRAGRQCDCAPHRRGCRGPRRKRRRRTQQRRRRSEKRACSDTIEESFSADEVDARRKRARYYKETPSCCLTHIQSDIFLHLHIITVRTHGRCSHDMWYHERASAHFTIGRSLRLKSEVSRDLGPILACACSAERLRSRRLRMCRALRSTAAIALTYGVSLTMRRVHSDINVAGKPSCRGIRRSPRTGRTITLFVLLLQVFINAAFWVSSHSRSSMGARLASALAWTCRSIRDGVK